MRPELSYHMNPMFVPNADTTVISCLKSFHCVRPSKTWFLLCAIFIVRNYAVLTHLYSNCQPIFFRHFLLKKSYIECPFHRDGRRNLCKLWMWTAVLLILIVSSPPPTYSICHCMRKVSYLKSIFTLWWYVKYIRKCI